MLKYLTGLYLVGFGQAFPDSSNHLAHELICLVEGVSGTPISGSRLSGNPLYRFDLRPLL
jgi:hypothetical protein